MSSTMLHIIFLLILPILIFCIIQKYIKNGKQLLPPGPSKLPIIGNLHQIDRAAPHLYLWQLSQKYGPLMFLKLGCVPTLVVSSAKMAKEILKTHDLVFASKPSFDGMKNNSYNWLDLFFAPYDDYWREMRKLCVLNLFSVKRVQSFSSVRKDEVSRMIKKISELASNARVINLSEIIMILTSTIVCRIAFSKRYDDGGYERSKYYSLLNEFQALSTSFFFKNYIPSLGWVDELTGLNGRFNKACQELDAFIQEHIDQHLDPRRAKSDHEDFLDVLLRLKNERSSAIDLNFDHIKGVIADVFIAGTDTSAVTIIWAMTSLIKNPSAMQKVQEEVRKIVGKKGFVEEDDIPKLPYLNSVIKEALRLYPPAPLLSPHKSMQTCIINGYEIPSETIVFINAWAIGRDQECWNDPEEFLPERFLGSTIDFRGHDFEFIPFGAGRRGCPGINMGIAVVQFALANLVYAFDWESPVGVKKEDIDTDTVLGSTMQKKNALCLVAQKLTLEE